MFCKIFLLNIVFIITVSSRKGLVGPEEYFDVHANEDDDTGFSNIWAVQLADGADPDEVARVNGFKNKGAINKEGGYYEFVHLSSRPVKRNGIRERRIHRSLSSHPGIIWLERQRYLTRVKRTFYLDDPKFDYQWYIRNTGDYNTGLNGMDLDILPVWEMGYTGKRVTVAVLDDGLDHTHPDIKPNYDPYASYDFNGDDPDPFPNDSDEYNGHGTKCSGEIAAVANNSVCGVGISFNAKIGGVRMLDGKATDSLEGHALGFRNGYIDIYSCSWGPKDDGQTFGRPGKMAKHAFVQGAKLGRKGKGNIFVWATGNGGLVDDDCDCDGYTTSIYTISVGSISDHGTSTFYSEKCASTMAVVYTSDSHLGTTATQDKLITTGLHHNCEERFRGTSSAAPLAAGIFALLLEANPNLTWRDVQHIVVKTAKKTSPMDRGWKTNGVGREYNHKFGFGVLDALAIVKAGLQWKTVPPQHICVVEGREKNVPILYRRTVNLKLYTDGCKRSENDEVKKVEHVEVTVSLRHRRRGNLNITVVSPSGTSSNLLAPRSRDSSTKGLHDWAFMTVHFWGEDPTGYWNVYVRDQEKTEEKRGEDQEDQYGKLLDKKKANRARDFIPGDYEFAHDEIHHGRYKEEYMRDEIPKEISENAWDFFQNPEKSSFSQKSSTVGELLNWHLTLYGTDS